MGQIITSTLPLRITLQQPTFVNSNRTGLLVSDLGSGIVATSVVAATAAVVRFPTATGIVMMGSTVTSMVRWRIVM